jgi:hypothetical protein
VPFFGSLIPRELQNLKRMTIRVFEIERFDSRRVLVPIGKPLRACGYVLDVILAQPGIGSIHVADNCIKVLDLKGRLVYLPHVQ